MSKKIAIIEDDKAIRELYVMQFQKDGFDVKSATNGQEGLDLIKSFWPDLILLDIYMPTMDGIEMLKKLRNEEWGKDIKVVVWTNNERQEAPSQLDNLNISRYVVKAEQTPRQLSEMVSDILAN